MAHSVQGRVSGKVAIVSGGGCKGPAVGNGMAASILLAREGAKVVIVDNNLDWAEHTLRQIQEEGNTAIAFQGDVSDPASCQGAVNRTVQEYGRLDILVNNVGVSGPPGTVLDVDIDAFYDNFRVNVGSILLMSRFSIPEMIKSANGGSIVNIGSYAGLFGGLPKITYATTKGAIPNLTRAMAAHHASDGVRVNCVAPGSVFSSRNENRPGMTLELREARKNRSLLKTEGTGWDVGYAVLYVASDEARWLTGVTLPVDAGASAAPNVYPKDTV